MPRVIRVNHIGLAVANLADALAVFSDGLGMEVAGSEDVPGDAVRVTFLPADNTNFELLEPVGEEGPVQRFLEKRGPGIHHICLEVEDLAGMLARLKKLGVELIDDEPRPGANGTLVAFVHPKSANGVLVELVESSSLSGSHGCR
jgi:methylmalonyl-CoA/ethylmalonyl-CoA epimerase